jgi:uncharacterized protein YjiS (DUF1127 family)
MIIILLLPKLDAYRRYRKTVRELSRLSDEELDDVGVYRSDIDMVARACTLICDMYGCLFSGTGSRSKILEQFGTTAGTCGGLCYRALLQPSQGRSCGRTTCHI